MTITRHNLEERFWGWTPCRTYLRVHSSANGMAASDPHPGSHPLPPGQSAGLSAQALRERLEEEINRAERHGTSLSCLLVAIENLAELGRRHGSELSVQT